MQIVFFCLIFLILGLLFSKIKIDIESFEINLNKINFKINLSLFLFGFIKIFTAKISEKGIKIFGKIYTFKAFFKKNLKDILKNKNEDKKILKKLKIKIDYANFKLKLGIDNVFITAFLVTAISGIIAITFNKKIKFAKLKKCKYVVLPEFNKNEINYKGILKLSINCINLLNLINLNNKN